MLCNVLRQLIQELRVEIGLITKLERTAEVRDGDEFSVYEAWRSIIQTFIQYADASKSIQSVSEAPFQQLRFD